MTKKYNEINNRLHNVEMALMDKSLGQAERTRLRQVQQDLRNLLRDMK